MCARFTLTLEEIHLAIAGIMQVIRLSPRFNIAPSQKVTALHSGPGGCQTTEMAWGFKTAWSNQLHVNAQVERLAQTQAFRPLLGQRCLVPMDGYYEWKSDQSPVRFTQPGKSVFCVAALWKAIPTSPSAVEPGWLPLGTTAPTTVPQPTSALVLLTQAAIPSVARIHHRMPFIVRPECYDAWLTPGSAGLPSAGIFDDRPVEYYPVSREVNRVRPDHPGLIEPIPEERELF